MSDYSDHSGLVVCSLALGPARSGGTWMKNALLILFNIFQVVGEIFFKVFISVPFCPKLLEFSVPER